MAFLTVDFYGTALNKACSMNVLLPDRIDGAGPFPVFYLLHGLSDDHTIWMRRTSIERYVQNIPMIVVMPDGGRSFYCDAIAGPAYETHFIRDVIGFVDTFFNTIADRSGRAIGGLSMGGYGALKLGLKFPGLFCSANSHSGAVDLTLRTPDRIREDMVVEFPQIFGEQPARGKDCLFGIAEGLNPEYLPNIRIDCGTEDGLLDANRKLRDHLDSHRIPHEYEEFPGAHTWDYWDTHIQEAIAFHRRAFQI